jgi:hypothetical protein
MKKHKTANISTCIETGEENAQRFGILGIIYYIFVRLILKTIKFYLIKLATTFSRQPSCLLGETFLLTSMLAGGGGVQ